VQVHAFLTSALDGGEWSASRSGLLVPWKVPSNHCIEECVGPRAGVCAVSRTNNFPALPENTTPVVHPVA